MKSIVGLRGIAVVGGLLAAVLALSGCGAASPGGSAPNPRRFESVAGTGAGSGAGAARVPAAAESGPYRNPAAISGGVQTIGSVFTSRRYAPITVQVGIPVRWTITMAQGDLNGCNGAMAIPKLDIRKRLQAGETVVEFTPTETGNLAYSCWMGMIRSTIIVVDDLSAAGAAL